MDTKQGMAPLSRVADFGNTLFLLMEIFTKAIPQNSIYQKQKMKMATPAARTRTMKPIIS